MKKTEDENDSNYHDDLIDVNKQSLTIKKYYFPTLSQKIIKINKIKSISMLELNRANGKYTFFGFCWTFHYYHLDRKRPCKTAGCDAEKQDKNARAPTLSGLRNDKRRICSYRCNVFGGQCCCGTSPVLFATVAGQVSRTKRNESLTTSLSEVLL